MELTRSRGHLQSWPSYIWGHPEGPGIPVRKRILEWQRELTHRSRRSRLVLCHERYIRATQMVPSDAHI